jgi:hypothetical protein
MPSHIPRNILLPLTKTWNTYSLGYYGSYLLQVYPMGLGTTLCCKHSAICALPCNGPPQQADREGSVIQERGRWREERSEIKVEEVAVYDRVRRN